MSEKKKRSGREMAKALAESGDAPNLYISPLVKLLARACKELERRIDAGDAAGGLSSIELIGTIKTAATILVEHDALLGGDNDKGADAGA